MRLCPVANHLRGTREETQSAKGCQALADTSPLLSSKSLLQKETSWRQHAHRAMKYPRLSETLFLAAKAAKTFRPPLCCSLTPRPSPLLPQAPPVPHPSSPPKHHLNAPSHFHETNDPRSACPASTVVHLLRPWTGSNGPFPERWRRAVNPVASLIT